MPKLSKQGEIMNWQPIDTAPKDGSWILLKGGEIDYGWEGYDQPPCVVGQYTNKKNGSIVRGHWQYAWYDGGYYGEYENPTHWMELPKP